MTHRKKYPSISYPDRQRGAVLIVSLILLISLTIIVLVSARNSALELNMGVNSQAQAEALARAEDSARAGELYILKQYQNGELVKDSVEGNDTPWVYATVNNTNKIENMNWKTMKIATDDIGNEYIIEFIGFIQESLGGNTAGLSDRVVYRVSGLGKSTNGTARVVQTYYATLITTP